MMKELIKIGASRIGDETVMTVSAREIAKFLGLKKNFIDWIKAQIKRAKLVQGVDYIVVKIYPQEGEKIKRGRPAEDYLLTVDAGKQVCMISGTDKGFEVRVYFMECEKIAIASTVPQIDQPQTVTQLHKDQVEAVAITEKMYRIHLRAAKTYGLKANQAVLSANNAAKKVVGVDLMKNMGVIHLIADNQERLLTPTEIGRIANIGSPQEVYKRLGVTGFQIDRRYLDYCNVKLNA